MMNESFENRIPDNLTGCMIFFVDEKSKEKIGIKTGCNQTGIFITDKDIIFVRNRKIKIILLDKLKGINVIINKIDKEEIIPSIVHYFNNLNKNYRLFNLGIRALANNNLKIFNNQRIMPYLIRKESKEKHNEKWIELAYKMKKGDLICTFIRNSMISKLIASIDNGSWSHCGIYIGDGKICETTTKGTVIRDIDVYNDINIHVGVYRSAHQSFDIDEITDKFVVENIGPGYGYLKAILLGIRTLLGENDNKFNPTDVTPNGIIYSGQLYLVGYV